MSGGVVHRVMVVDDDVSFLAVALRSMPGRDVLVESDARRVEARVCNERPDLVIIDQWLNDDILGHELANTLKQRYPSMLVALWSSGLDVIGMKYLTKYSHADYVDIKTSNFDQLIACVSGTAVPEEPDWNAIPTIEDMRKELAVRTLARSRGNKSQAARLLRKDRTTFMRWLGRDDPEQA